MSEARMTDLSKTDQPAKSVVWVVYKQWPMTGKIERVGAYRFEDNARYEVAKMVGQDGALIGLEIIPISDEI